MLRMAASPAFLGATLPPQPAPQVAQVSRAELRHYPVWPQALTETLLLGRPPNPGATTSGSQSLLLPGPQPPAQPEIHFHTTLSSQSF